MMHQTETTIQNYRQNLSQAFAILTSVVAIITLVIWVCSWLYWVHLHDLAADRYLDKEAKTRAWQKAQ